ncbi:MAG: TetR/AcrR family transcriptional regulator, partial [Clostridia bacterium]
MDEQNNSRRLRKKNNTHKALLHSAKKLFEDKGIGNVTIDEISEAADVSRSTFFTHFASLDDLLEQIANEEISDLAAVWQDSDVSFSITALMDKLVEDTIPYPYLTGELLMRGILSKGESSSFNEIYNLAEERISTHYSYEKTLEYFTTEEISALLLGSYFGFVFQR